MPIIGKDTVGDRLGVYIKNIAVSSGPFAVAGRITLKEAGFYAYVQGQVRICVYTDLGGNPDRLIAEWPAEVCLATQWNRLAPVNVVYDGGALGAYHIVWKMEVDGMGVTEAMTGQGKYRINYWRDPFPDPFGTPEGAYNTIGSVYVEYTTELPPPQLTVDITPKNPAVYVRGTKEPDSVLLTANVTGGILPYTYQWTSAGSPIPGATESTLEISMPTEGVYEVGCTVTDGEAAVASDSTFVTVMSPTVAKTIRVGFENDYEFETPEEGPQVFASQSSWFTRTFPTQIFEPATDIVHSGNRSARLALTNPISDEAGRRIHIRHLIDPYDKHVWTEAWYYLPPDFVVDDWTLIHAALSERWFTAMGPIHYFAFGYSLVSLKRNPDGSYPLETILNHGWVDNDGDGVNDLGPNQWIYTKDGLRLGEWTKITTYIYRDMDPTKGRLVCWMKREGDETDILQYDINCRTIGIEPATIASLPATGGGERAWVEQGIDLYTGSPPCTPKEIRVDDVMLSSEEIPSPPTPIPPISPIIFVQAPFTTGLFLVLLGALS